MARRQTRFLTGLFVIVGVIIGVAGIIWLGASKYFEKGQIYVTYFDESVQGLQVDSEVKYRGVGVGTVKSIGVAADQKLVEVVIKIALAVDIEHSIVAQLRTAGITGIVFVELDQRRPDDEVFLPSAKEVKASYPIIPSKQSQIRQMLSGLDQLLERLVQVDLRAITESVTAASRSLETFFSGDATRKILGDLDSTLLSITNGMRRIDAVLAKGAVEGIIDETRQGLGDVRQGVAETREAVAGLKEAIAGFKARELAGKAEKFLDGLAGDADRLVDGLTGKADLLVERWTGSADRLVDRLDRHTRKMAADIELTTEELRRAIEHLQALLDRLQGNPSDLIFSTPRPDGGEPGKR